ncbi:30S ribosomal protein S19e [Candidatus Woesearchaeota archaeon]|nr:MAG: 30S ribosomal protein S19e [Candidatus Woesearchaeota archaeon]
MAMYDVDQQALVTALAAELKRQHVVVPPEWAAFAKTGAHRERPPADEDWWYTRAASVLRTVYLLGPIGTQKLRTRYGGRKNRGVAPDRFYCAGGNHLRKILQQLEAAKLVKQEKKGAHKGRVITPLGRKLIHAIAGVVSAEQKAAAKPAKAQKTKPAVKTAAKTVAESAAESAAEPEAKAAAKTAPKTEAPEEPAMTEAQPAKKPAREEQEPGPQDEQEPKEQEPEPAEATEQDPEASTAAAPSGGAEEKKLEEGS